MRIMAVGLKVVLKGCAVLITSLLAVTSAALITQRVNSAGQQEDRQIPVNVTQLPSDSGGLPVEMRCSAGHSSAPNKLDNFSCLIINNTRKNISALAVEYSIITEGVSGASRETSLLTEDSAFHPDIKEARRLRLLPPGESRTLRPPGPIAFENETVSSVEINIDYVEFDDKTSIGAETGGSKMINSMREGAAKYKAWLIERYKRGRMEESAVAALLEQSDLPKELNFGANPNLNEGASLYRRIMLSVYTTRGAAELRRYLNK